MIAHVKREHNPMDELLVKYLLGEADAAEHLAVKKWRDARPDNEQYFRQFKLIWDASKEAPGFADIDESDAWKRMQQRLQQGSTPAASKKKAVFLSLRNMLRAAAVVVVCLAGYGVYDYQGRQQVTVHATTATRTEQLSDGSVVVLNKNATIRYPKRFQGDTRELSLEGEAFFTISADKTHPFIIHARGVNVKVVGTSFNVKAYSGKTEVIVETGIVEVSRRKEHLRLYPSETATVSADAAMVKDVAKDALYNYYRTNEFVCNNTPLWRLAEVLGEAYNTHVVIANDAIRDLPLTATFRNESLDGILAIISETLDITAERRGTEVILQ